MLHDDQKTAFQALETVSSVVSIAVPEFAVISIYTGIALNYFGDPNAVPEIPDADEFQRIAEEGDAGSRRLTLRNQLEGFVNRWQQLRTKVDLEKKGDGSADIATEDYLNELKKLELDFVEFQPQVIELESKNRHAGVLKFHEFKENSGIHYLRYSFDCFGQFSILHLDLIGEILCLLREAHQQDSKNSEVRLYHDKWLDSLRYYSGYAWDAIYFICGYRGLSISVNPETPTRGKTGKIYYLDKSISSNELGTRYFNKRRKSTEFSKIYHQVDEDRANYAKKIMEGMPERLIEDAPILKYKFSRHSGELSEWPDEEIREKLLGYMRFRRSFPVHQEFSERHEHLLDHKFRESFEKDIYS